MACLPEGHDLMVTLCVGGHQGSAGVTSNHHPIIILHHLGSGKQPVWRTKRHQFQFERRVQTGPDTDAFQNTFVAK